MKLIKLFLAVLLPVLIIAGCSSMPKRQIPEALLEADRYMKSAGTAELQLQFSRSLNLYKKAFDSYTRMDNLKGKIRSGLGMARMYNALGDQLNHDLWVQIVGDYTSFKRNFRPLLDLHIIRLAYDREEYDLVIQNTSEFPAEPLNWALEARAYRALALIMSGKDASGEKAFLNSEIRRIGKQFDKNRLDQPELYPFLLYTLGYVATAEKNWDTAIDRFESARKADQDLGNSIGIAADLYAQARCYEIQGRNDLALVFYTRAADIYCLLEDEPNCLLCREKIESMQ